MGRLPSTRSNHPPPPSTSGATTKVAITAYRRFFVIGSHSRTGTIVTAPAIGEQTTRYRIAADGIATAAGQRTAIDCSVANAMPPANHTRWAGSHIPAEFGSQSVVFTTTSHSGL